MIDGKTSIEHIHNTAQIAARFSDAKSDDIVILEINSPSGFAWMLKILPFTEDQIRKEWYISG